MPVRKKIEATITVVLCVAALILGKNALEKRNQRLSDRVVGSYTCEYDITYAVEEALETAYNISIDIDDVVHFNANIRLLPDDTFRLTFDTNGFNEELLEYCAAVEDDLLMDVDEYSLRSYMARYLNDLFAESTGTYEVDNDEINFSGSGLTGLHAERRNNDSFNLYFTLTDGTEFGMTFYKE